MKGIRHGHRACRARVKDGRQAWIRCSLRAGDQHFYHEAGEGDGDRARNVSYVRTPSALAAKGRSPLWPLPCLPM